jgi:hypothetical protein
MSSSEHIVGDDVDHPSHYTQLDKPFECIELTRICTSDLANVIKYLWRWRDKGSPVKDLRKALWYLKDGIEYQVMPIPSPNRTQRYLLARVAASTNVEYLDERKIWVALADGEYELTISRLESLVERTEKDFQS